LSESNTSLTCRKAELARHRQGQRQISARTRPEAFVSKLSTLIFIFVSPTLAGIFVIAVLAADMALSNAMPIIVAAVLGVVAAIPASYFISRAIVQDAERRRERVDAANG
jgi:hypothetical protein